MRIPWIKDIILVEIQANLHSRRIIESVISVSDDDGGGIVLILLFVKLNFSFKFEWTNVLFIILGTKTEPDDDEFMRSKGGSSKGSSLADLQKQ